MSNKFDRIVFKQAPRVTNPNKIVGYAKSLYFGYLLFKLRGLENKIMWVNAAPYKPAQLSSMIMSASDKLSQLQNLKTLTKSTKYGSNYISQDDYSDTNKIEGKAKAYVNKVQTVKRYERNSGSRKKSSNYVKTVKKHY